MIVCHCKAVSDRTIREAIRLGARSPREVSMACGAGRGRQCGGCLPAVRELLACETHQSEPAATEIPVAAAS